MKEERQVALTDQSKYKVYVQERNTRDNSLEMKTLKHKEKYTGLTH